MVDWTFVLEKKPRKIAIVANLTFLKPFPIYHRNFLSITENVQSNKHDRNYDSFFETMLKCKHKLNANSLDMTSLNTLLCVTSNGVWLIQEIHFNQDKSQTYRNILKGCTGLKEADFLVY